MLKKFREWWNAEPDTVHEEVAPDEPKAHRAQRRTFKDVYPENYRIELLVSKNPKRKGSAAYNRYEKYRKAGTVGQALLVGIPYKDIDNDYQREYIKVMRP